VINRGNRRAEVFHKEKAYAFARLLRAGCNRRTMRLIAIRRRPSSSDDSNHRKNTGLPPLVSQVQ
jgi:hypothetical protein